MNQRFVELTFYRDGANERVVNMPSNAYETPPGFYMMFAVDSAGVPSTEKTILAAFWPHGRTRSRIVRGASIHGRAPALVSANVLLSTTTRSPSTS